MVTESPGPASQTWNAAHGAAHRGQRHPDGQAPSRRLRVGPRRHPHRRRRQPLPRLLQRHRHHQHRPCPPARRRGDRTSRPPSSTTSTTSPRRQKVAGARGAGRGDAARHVAVHVLLVGHRGHRGARCGWPGRSPAGSGSSASTTTTTAAPAARRASPQRGRRTRLRDRRHATCVPSGHAYRCTFCAGSCDLRCADVRRRVAWRRTCPGSSPAR